MGLFNSQGFIIEKQREALVERNIIIDNLVVKLDQSEIRYSDLLLDNYDLKVELHNCKTPIELSTAMHRLENIER